MRRWNAVPLMAMLAVAAFAGSGPIAANQSQAARDAAPTTPATPAPAGTATITGRVVIMIDRQWSPVRRARVTLQSDTAATFTTDTDTDGRYRFDHLVAGTYRIVVDKPGFVPVLQGGRRAFDPPPPFDLKAGQSLTADIQMQRGAALQGRVVTDTGDPAANIVVSAVRLVYGPYGKRPSAIRTAVTDDQGRFRVHTLPAGDYYLDAAPDPRTLASGMPPAGDRPVIPARTYYPGTPRVSDARLVTLVTGQDAENLDFTVVSVPVATVNGVVTDSAGNPPAQVGFRVQGVGAPPGQVLGFQTQQEGGFDFRLVPPGDYWLLATTVSAPGATPEFAAQRINVAGQDITGLTVATARSVVVTGRVEVDGAASPLPPGLQVTAVQTDFELPTPQGGASPVVPVNVGVDGTFTLSGVFGPRVLQIGPLKNGWALQGVWMGERDVTDTVVDFKSGETIPPLRVVITSKTATVSGAVHNDQDQPIAAARVVIFGRDEQKWGLRSRAIKSVEAAADGQFTVDGLLPGDYFVAATAALEDGSWFDPEVLSRLKPAASSVTVTAAQKLTLTLKVR
jgi:hypothetical protein